MSSAYSLFILIVKPYSSWLPIGVYASTTPIATNTSPDNRTVKLKGILLISSIKRASLSCGGVIAGKASANDFKIIGVIISEKGSIVENHHTVNAIANSVKSSQVRFAGSAPKRYMVGTYRNAHMRFPMINVR